MLTYNQWAQRRCMHYETFCKWVSVRCPSRHALILQLVRWKNACRASFWFVMSRAVTQFNAYRRLPSIYNLHSNNSPVSATSILCDTRWLYNIANGVFIAQRWYIYHYWLTSTNLFFKESATSFSSTKTDRIDRRLGLLTTAGSYAVVCHSYLRRSIRLGTLQVDSS